MLVGVCAYNEEKNIGRLLQNLVLEQDLPEDCTILVICSGCTDRTPEIVKRLQGQDKRIELITEKERTGKASALNTIFRRAKKSSDVLVLVNADALPEKGSINKLLAALGNSKTGAVFAQPVPFEDSQGTCHNIVRVIWRLHHIISLHRRPKLSGELCAIPVFCIQEIPKHVATDEPYIEIGIRKRGYEISYVPSATVHIRCPTNVVDLLKQRKRIWIGHLQLENETGFKVSTSDFGNVVRMASALEPNELPYLLLGGCLEGIARVQAEIQASKGSIPYAWEPIFSTKN